MLDAFSSPVPSADAALVAALLAVDPAGLGGVALRAPAGPLRDAWLTLLRDGLPASTPMHRVPLHATDSALLGGLDLAATLHAPGSPSQRLAAGVQQFAARAWHSRRLAYALIAEPVEPQVDEQRLIYRRAYAELFSGLLAEGMAAGQFARLPLALTAACLVGAIAEALVGPLAPAAQSPQPDPQQLAAVSLGLSHFCLRAVGADRAAARVLGVPVGQPVLQVRRVAIALGGQPVEWRVSTVVTGQHDYVNLLSRPA